MGLPECKSSRRGSLPSAHKKDTENLLVTSTADIYSISRIVGRVWLGLKI